MIITAFKDLIPFMYKSASVKQKLSKSWEDRGHILDEDVNMFCWERPKLIGAMRYIGHIMAAQAKTISQEININQLSRQISQMKVLWPLSDSIEGDVFWEDVHRITKDFLKLSNQSEAHIKLEVITGDACTKFHVDNFDLRLFTTYWGPGTLWLKENNIRRYQLGSTNSKIVKDPMNIQQMDTCHVGILKGEPIHLKGQRKGVVHMSPQISEWGLKRVTMKIDVNTGL